MLCTSTGLPSTTLIKAFTAKWRKVLRNDELYEASLVQATYQGGDRSQVLLAPRVEEIILLWRSQCKRLILKEWTSHEVWVGSLPWFMEEGQWSASLGACAPAGIMGTTLSMDDDTPLEKVLGWRCCKRKETKYVNGCYEEIFQDMIPLDSEYNNADFCMLRITHTWTPSHFEHALRKLGVCTWTPPV